MLRSLALPLLLTACGSDSASSDNPDTAGPGMADTGDADLQALGRCDYINPFSAGAECKEYLGLGWTLDDAAADCETPVLGADPGAFTEGLSCAREDIIGECIVAGGEELETVIVFPGDDPEACSGAELGCSFSGGEFIAGQVCLDGGDDGGISSDDAFVTFSQVCVDPIAGEPEGAGPDGQVCTWEAISGSTEEGRDFVDYASCEPVLTQRPYYPASVDVPDSTGDARLDDTAYMEELAWFTDQVEASACVCCHSTDQAPSGPSGWYIDAGDLWLDTLDDDGLAMLAGWVDSTVFGAFAADDNNGFSRDQTGLPTTDPARLETFIAAELARRGKVQADFADTQPFGGVLYDQLFYEPQACGEGEGIGDDGEIVWTGGAARYLYVLQADSMSPGVPPNLDLPDGTLWRLDVAWDSAPLPSGVALGDQPDGTSQAWPADGSSPQLESGQQYYLVSLLDIYQPATRCLFTAP